MSGTVVERITCSACQIAPEQYRHLCHECHGVGYLENIAWGKNCTTSLPECPVSYDPGIDGWECSECGLSGPCSTPKRKP